MSRKWTIQVFYDARDDNGRQFRATCCYQLEADDVGAAYAIAEKNLPDKKLGAIIPGHRVMLP